MPYPYERPYTGPPPSWYDEPDEIDREEPDEDLIRDTYGDYPER
jgi:hypothetical protein